MEAVASTMLPRATRSRNGWGGTLLVVPANRLRVAGDEVVPATGREVEVRVVARDSAKWGREVQRHTAALIDGRAAMSLGHDVAARLQGLDDRGGGVGNLIADPCGGKCLAEGPQIHQVAGKEHAVGL